MKQSKVSMVVPCYNKERYIGAMLESVYRQVWDSIELILVNDGSTDGTRGIIAEWEPKLRARGYEVVIVDQENAGCCAAVHAGLLRMTGEYYCLADCDDEIMPEYVSRMAGWLDGHAEYEWAACSFQSYVNTGGDIETRPFSRYPVPQDTEQMLENYILRRIITTVWIYMARRDYVERCKMIEHFCAERRMTYEPLIAVPLMAGGGRLKFFEEPLYKYNMFASDMFKFDKFEDVVKYYDDYLYLYDWSIRRLASCCADRERLRTVAELAYKKELFNQIENVSDGKDKLDSLTESTLALADRHFSPAPRISADRVKETGHSPFFLALEDCVLGIKKELPSELSGRRVIAYGALGKVAGRLLPFLKGGVAEPAAYWDAAATESSRINGVAVSKPDFARLSASDVLLVFPLDAAICEAVRAVCGDALVMGPKEVTDICFRCAYLEFYEKSEFCPNAERRTQIGG